MIKGLDVSHHNGVIDWAKQKANGIEFAYIKATEGLNYTDPMFKSNAKRAKDAGIITGAYHFFRPAQDAAGQARHFLDRISGLGLELPHNLDWEVSDGVRAGAQKNAAMVWLSEVQTRTFRVPSIYGSPYFLSDLGLSKDFFKYPLWIANYHVKAPRIPQPWTEYWIWQTSDDNGWDHDIFNGTIEDLKGLKSA